MEGGIRKPPRDRPDVVFHLVDVESQEGRRGSRTPPRPLRGLFTGPRVEVEVDVQEGPTPVCQVHKRPTEVDRRHRRYLLLGCPSSVRWSISTDRSSSPSPTAVGTGTRRGDLFFGLRVKEVDTLPVLLS